MEATKATDTDEADGSMHRQRLDLFENTLNGRYLAMASLREVDSLGDTYKSFSETKRWNVVHEGDVIGQIWRAKRYVDNVICWMVKPAVLDFSFPQSGILGGYRATTKKGAIDELIDWHTHATLNHQSGDWTFRCFHRWLASEYNDPECKDEKRRYFAIHSDGKSRWISLEFVGEEQPFQGMMGTPGWHASGYRGTRRVIVHQAATPEEALDTLISIVSLAPSKEETEKRNLGQSLPLERHYGSLAAGPTP